MRTRLLIAMAVFVLFVCAWTVGYAQGKLSEFKVVIEPSATGLKGECLTGCAWKTASFSCGQEKPCRIAVDESGIGRFVPEKPAK